MKKTGRITDAQMLAAARRALMQHLDTRPATREEADAIRQKHLDAAKGLRDSAKQLRNTRYLPALSKHENMLIGTAVNMNLKDAGLCDLLAGQQELYAAAWECPGEDMSEVWEATRRELEARVAYYERLMAR